MTDRRAAAPGAGATGLLGFLAEAFGSLRNRLLVLPALLLAVLLTATNIVLARHFPQGGEAVSLQFVAAAVLRVLGLFALAVALLRAANDSPRPLWRADAAFWLYGATLIAGFGITAGVTILFGGRDDAWTELITGLVVALLTAPFAAWFTALAVERPLAWRARPWLRHFRRWLPALLFWSLLLLLPLGQVHRVLALRLIEGGPWFWPLALVDGPLSLVIALVGLALASAAYRRVARN